MAPNESGHNLLSMTRVASVSAASLISTSVACCVAPKHTSIGKPPLVRRVYNHNDFLVTCSIWIDAIRVAASQSSELGEIEFFNKNRVEEDCGGFNMFSWKEI